jgi:hypothetical protein
MRREKPTPAPLKAKGAAPSPRKKKKFEIWNFTEEQKVREKTEDSAPTFGGRENL